MTARGELRCGGGAQDVVGAGESFRRGETDADALADGIECRALVGESLRPGASGATMRDVDDLSGGLGARGGMSGEKFVVGCTAE